MNNRNKKSKKSKRNGASRYTLAKLGKFSNYEKYNITFVDPHKFITLKYCDSFNESLATVTGTDQIMNMNSLFDPDRTGAGHQPYGYDSLALLYNRYRVWGLRWRITFHAEAQGFYVVVLPSNGALATAITNQASFALAGESPRSYVSSQGTGANAVIVTGRIELNDLNGTTVQEYKADDRFQAIFGASPSELMLLHIGTYNPSGSTLAVDFLVELWFDVEVHDPIMLAQS